jgi:hypothetical protein
LQKEFLDNVRLQRGQMPGRGLKRPQTRGIAPTKSLEKSFWFHFVDSSLSIHAAAGVVQTFLRKSAAVILHAAF